MNENITRISDLPDSYNIHPPQQQNDLGLQNSYIPINVHANPYGNNSPHNQQLPPFPNNKDSDGLNEEHRRMIDNTPIQRLPSRDIRIEPSQITQDEQTRVNYIPPADDLSNDFVREYQMNNEKKLKKHDQEKHRVRLMDRVFTEIQIPLLLAILFFIFQMPLIDRFFFKYFIFFSVNNADGQLNLYGMLIKSVLFGLFYYLTITSVDLISEL